VGLADFRCRRAAPDQRGEPGFTLIDTLVAVMLAGIVFSMIGALFTMTVVSDKQRRLSVAQTEGRRFAEKVRAQKYVLCASDYPDAVADSNWTDSQLVENVDTTSSPVKWWQGTFPPGPNPQPVWNSGGTCPGTVKDCGMQQITVDVSVGGATTQYTFIKRSDDALLQRTAGCP